MNKPASLLLLLVFIIAFPARLAYIIDMVTPIPSLLRGFRGKANKLSTPFSQSSLFYRSPSSFSFRDLSGSSSRKVTRDPKAKSNAASYNLPLYPLPSSTKSDIVKEQTRWVRLHNGRNVAVMALKSAASDMNDFERKNEIKSLITSTTMDESSQTRGHTTSNWPQHSVSIDNYASKNSEMIKMGSQMTSNDKKIPKGKGKDKHVSFSDKTTVVQSVEDARRILKIMKEFNSETRYWACDTEVADIDLKEVGPVGNGKVTCVSIFGGPDVDFGDGPGTALWVDNLGACDGLLQEFKSFFEDDNLKKVWHNYGFDRHVMYNEGIDCKGFFGDTMHMARLWDTSRDKVGAGKGYSLESLSQDLIEDDRFFKVSMKELFGVGKILKDGSASKVKTLPPIRDLQVMPEFRDKWIEYSVKDAIATWYIHEKLVQNLANMQWCVNDKPLVDANNNMCSMLDFYNEYLLDFGDLLTDMERNGIKVDTEGHLKRAEALAREERSRLEAIFFEWASGYCKDAKYINPASTAQIQQLLFGNYENEVFVDAVREFKADKSEDEYNAQQEAVNAVNPYAQKTSTEIKAICKERKLKVSGKKQDLVDSLMMYDQHAPAFLPMSVEELEAICHGRGISVKSGSSKEVLIRTLVEDAAYRESLKSPSLQNGGNDISGSCENENDTYKANGVAGANGRIKKYHEFSIKTIGIKPLEFTPTGSAKVSASVLRELAGKNLDNEKEAVYGKAKAFFPTEEEGKAACRAIGALAAIGQIDATITNFLVPLQALVDKNSRIHCSLNLNTETGRLSSRKPNLQNQPALEKDQFKIRDAFIAEPGNTLIVADYGQLELRILAHITSCQSMIEAFKSGGCFHSRTAVGMYDYIKEAVDNGVVLLEWDYSKGQPTAPLVKDTYASERRKAKTLNFSIAYGKTVHGLAADWGISTEEAEKTLAAWYNDRPEVAAWQDKTRELAMKKGWVRTMMGRYRTLPDARTKGPGRGHALRAAINTPIQGSAADVVMMAMIKLWKSERLRELKWKLLLQIHDEVILEGPKESKDEALKEVIHCMENPWDHWGLSPLSVHLDVDAKSADSWYKAK